MTIVMRFPGAAPLRIGGAVAAGLLVCAGALAAEVRHGISVFGDLKYAPGFAHFDYVDPDAPKGGELRMWALDSYDSLNPFILKGVAAAGVGLIYETLMTPADDEADAMYGLIAESVELAPDRSWAAFTIRPQARWWDGAPITAEDVVFSFEVLLSKGHPRYKVIYRDVERAEAEAILRRHGADVLERNVHARGDADEVVSLLRLDREHDARLGFAEERGVQPVADDSAGGVEPVVRRQAHLRQRHGQAAVGAVVRGGGDILADGGEGGPLHSPLQLQVDVQAAADLPVLQKQVLARTQRL